MIDKLNFSWNNIRSLNNSQNKAFEELVCQLARKEKIKNKQTFHRIEAPDGGVEAYCVLNNKKEIGWQAKYFFTFGNSQCQQIEKSFKTAVKTHPNLFRYIICLPINLNDPRIKNRKGQIDIWKREKSKLELYAQKLNKSVHIDLWQSSNLIEKLSDENNIGIYFFWFNEKLFTHDWFVEQVKNNIANLGQRYTPELNVELDISKNFNGLAYDDSFKKLLESKYDHFLRSFYKHNLNNFINTEVKSHYKEILNKIELIKNWHDNINLNELDFININNINKIFNEMTSNVDKIVSILEDFLKNNKNDKKNNIENDRLRSNIYYLREINRAIYNYSNFINCNAVKLSQNPVLIIQGKAGIGKSHLLANGAINHIKNEKSAILLLGQHFATNESPWVQIKKIIST
ncbi:MAG TPA: hypothetical protein DC049_11745, partial [Spirochaetia bacterium]|nr:hypothetical protein [Spirochaetia bacterium]